MLSRSACPNSDSPAMPKKVWKTSTMSSGRSEMPPLSSSCQHPNNSASTFTPHSQQIAQHCHKGQSRQRILEITNDLKDSHLTLQNKVCESTAVNPMDPAQDAKS
jgi:hypothetical protein